MDRKKAVYIVAIVAGLALICALVIDRNKQNDSFEGTNSSWSRAGGTFIPGTGRVDALTYYDGRDEYKVFITQQGVAAVLVPHLHPTSGQYTPYRRLASDPPRP